MKDKDFQAAWIFCFPFMTIAVITLFFSYIWLGYVLSPDMYLGWLIRIILTVVMAFIETVVFSLCLMEKD